MSMRIQPDTLRSEVEQVLAILSRWKERLDAGIPGDEIPGNDLNVEIFQYQLRGELQLSAERLLAIVEVLEG
jgi:hypothetical protein